MASTGIRSPALNGKTWGLGGREHLLTDGPTDRLAGREIGMVLTGPVGPTLLGCALLLSARPSQWERRSRAPTATPATAAGGDGCPWPFSAATTASYSARFRYA